MKDGNKQEAYNMLRDLGYTKYKSSGIMKAIIRRHLGDNMDSEETVSRMMSGRPERETIIQKDEITNLLIDLNTLDVNEFINKI